MTYQYEECEDSLSMNHKKAFQEIEDDEKNLKSENKRLRRVFKLIFTFILVLLDFRCKAIKVF